MHRRELLETAVAISGASLLGSQSAARAEQPALQSHVVDTNVSLFQWPFRRLPLDQTQLLVWKLRELGITQAWAGSFEGLLHRDIRGVNQRLAVECARHPELLPIGSLNLELPAWEDDFQRCTQDHRMPGVRLHPNYHGYTLSDPRFRRLLRLAATLPVLIQIAVAMEDTRTQHRLVQVSDVDLAPLSQQLRDHPSVRVQLLNARPRGPQLEDLAGVPGVLFDIARIDGTDGLQSILSKLSPDRVLFGTHAPFLIPEAALIRLHESRLNEQVTQQLLATNAQRLLQRSLP